MTVVRDPRLDESEPLRPSAPLRLVGSENVNVELVRQGAASPYFFRNTRGRYADALLDAVEEGPRREAGLLGYVFRAEPKRASARSRALLDGASRPADLGTGDSRRRARRGA